MGSEFVHASFFMVVDWWNVLLLINSDAFLSLLHIDLLFSTLLIQCEQRERGYRGSGHHPSSDPACGEIDGQCGQ